MIKLIGRDFRKLLPHFWHSWLYAAFLGVSFVIITGSAWKALVLASLVAAQGIIVAMEHNAYNRHMLGQKEE